MKYDQKFTETYFFKYETPEAIQLSHEQGDENKHKFWLPKSQIEYERRGRLVEVTMSVWLAKSKELV